MALRIQAKTVECSRARILAGLSIRQAAKSLTVSATHLSQIEHGRNQPSPSLLKRMADLYGVPMESLFTAVGRDAA
jgi:transcriptional regulator with XRE-family HTH domain